ncbi:MAG: hypothetical protein AAFP16_10220 [Pseudomonadota bacterium]
MSVTTTPASVPGTGTAKGTYQVSSVAQVIADKMPNETRADVIRELFAGRPGGP